MSVSRLYMVLTALISVAFIALVFLFREQAEEIVSLMGSFSGSPIAIGVAILVFLIGSIILIPQWLLIGAAVAAFGLVEGVGIAWLATMVAATTHVLTARAFESRVRPYLSGERGERIRAMLRRNSVEAGFLVRLVPTGPAIFVNAAAGLFRVSRSGFLIGTAIGIIPKIILTGVVTSELLSSAQAQQVSLGLIVFAILLIAVFVWSRRKRPVSAEK
ncbi:MAG: VTT domain-containing protein [Pseudomonadota bacterium]